MKKIVNPPSNGQIPLYSTDFGQYCQDEIYSALYAPLYYLGSINETVILKGCAVSSVDTGASTLVISSGIIYLDGEAHTFSGYTGSYPIYICQDTPTFEQRSFKDSSSKNAIRTTRLKASPTVPVSGQYVLFSPYSSQYLHYLTFRTNHKINQVIDYSGAIVLDKDFDSSGLGLFEWNGFALCNGANGTPDLRKKFIAGYDPADAEFHLGTTGGANSVTLTGAQSGLKDHTHTATVHDSGHSHTYGDQCQSDADSSSNNSGSGESIMLNQQDQGRTTSTATTGITVTLSNSGGSDASQAHENRPLYYTAIKIMRIA